MQGMLRFYDRWGGVLMNGVAGDRRDMYTSMGYGGDEWMGFNVEYELENEVGIAVSWLDVTIRDLCTFPFFVSQWEEHDAFFSFSFLVPASISMHKIDFL